MHKFLLVFVIQTTCLAQELYADSKSVTVNLSERASCAQMWESFSNAAGPRLENAQSTETIQSVFFDHQRPGQYGGYIWRLKRSAELSWLSKYNTNGANFQNDPRLLIEALGAKTARFFGFHEYKDINALDAANAEEFSGALDVLEPYLQLPIGLRFYSLPPGMELEEVTAYVGNSSEDRLPVAVQGVTQIHDLSHYLASLLPESVRRHAGIISKYTLLFSKHVAQLADQPNLDPYLQQHLKSLSQNLINYRAEQVDQGTGNVARYILQSDDLSFFEQSIVVNTLIWEPLVLGGASAYEFLEQILSQEQEKFTYSPKYRTAYEPFLKSFEQFLHRYEQNSDFKQNLSLVAGVPFYEDEVQHAELCRLIQARRLDIIQAVERLTSGELVPMPHK